MSVPKRAQQVELYTRRKCAELEVVTILGERTGEFFGRADHDPIPGVLLARHVQCQASCVQLPKINTHFQNVPPKTGACQAAGDGLH